MASQSRHVSIRVPDELLDRLRAAEIDRSRLFREAAEREVAACESPAGRRLVIYEADLTALLRAELDEPTYRRVATRLGISS